MSAGDFVEVYGSTPNSWDCVITCFFIDTAPVVLTYVDVIHRILKPGGFWINLGACPCYCLDVASPALALLLHPPRH